MSNIIDINSRKKIAYTNVSIISNDLLQNKNLSPLSIAVAVYIISKSDCSVDTDVVKKHFNIEDEIMEIVFEQLVEEGYISIWETNCGTRDIWCSQSCHQ